MADLALTFEVDDEVFGERIATPLRPGGSALDVTNDNRIMWVTSDHPGFLPLSPSRILKGVPDTPDTGRAPDVATDRRYCHLMADYKLNRQFQEHTKALLAGFRSIISPRWLRYFSAPELQRLISGDDVALDVQDLARHAEYIGGYTSWVAAV